MGIQDFNYDITDNTILEVIDTVYNENETSITIKLDPNKSTSRYYKNISKNIPSIAKLDSINFKNIKLIFTLTDDNKLISIKYLEEYTCVLKFLFFPINQEMNGNIMENYFYNI